ncbi:MAG: CHAT domain-containing tetratricopeptide repeat protein [Cyanobacteria bacterium P01_A01_bin.17]
MTSIATTRQDLLAQAPQTETTPTAEADRWLWRGAQLFKANRAQESLKPLRAALQVFQRVNDRPKVSETLFILGRALTNLGQYQLAQTRYTQALAIFRESENRTGESYALAGLGSILRNLGQYQQALQMQQESLKIAREIKDTSSEASLLNNIALTYSQLGQYQKAVDTYRESLVQIRAVKDRNKEAATLNSIATVYLRTRQYQQAIGIYKEALVIAQQENNRFVEGSILNNIGLLQREQKQYRQALDTLQQALAITQELGLRAHEGTTLNNIGLIYEKLGRYQKALQAHQQSLTIIRAVGNRAGEGNILANIGALHLLQEQFPQAEQSLKESIGIFESLRPGLVDTNKVSLFDTYSTAYDSLQRALVAQNKAEQALEISERGRARAFAELLAANKKSDLKASNSIKAPSVEKIRAIARQQNSTLVQYSVLSLQDLPNILLIWVVKPTGEISMRSVELDRLSTPLNLLVDASRDAIGAGGRGSIKVVSASTNEQRKKLQRLHDVLIQPIQELLPNDPQARVTIIPHGLLFSVPFAALQDSAGNYLIERHTVVTSPSIHALNLTQQQKSQIQNAGMKETLVVGNPTMPTLRIANKVEQLASLPGAEQEAEKIAALLQTQALIGKDATKATVLSRLPKANIVHLATHGLLDSGTRFGVPGAIALAPSQTDNGLLTADELFKLNLNADLVVLSACNTARGKITADGVIGLSRSLIAAGTPSVLVSLWAVPDVPTADLMVEFYTQLLKGREKDQALRQAMLMMINRESTAAPINWAAFTLIGESEKLSF